MAPPNNADTLNQMITNQPPFAAPPSPATFLTPKITAELDKSLDDIEDLLLDDDGTDFHHAASAVHDSSVAHPSVDHALRQSTIAHINSTSGNSSDLPHFNKATKPPNVIPGHAAPQQNNFMSWKAVHMEIQENSKLPTFNLPVDRSNSLMGLRIPAPRGRRSLSAKRLRKYSASSGDGTTNSAASSSTNIAELAAAVDACPNSPIPKLGSSNSYGATSDHRVIDEILRLNENDLNLSEMFLDIDDRFSAALAYSSNSGGTHKSALQTSKYTASLSSNIEQKNGAAVSQNGSSESNPEIARGVTTLTLPPKPPARASNLKESRLPYNRSKPLPIPMLRNFMPAMESDKGAGGDNINTINNDDGKNNRIEHSNMAPVQTMAEAVATAAAIANRSSLTSIETSAVPIDQTTAAALSVQPGTTSPKATIQSPLAAPTPCASQVSDQLRPASQPADANAPSAHDAKNSTLTLPNHAQPYPGPVPAVAPSIDNPPMQPVNGPVPDAERSVPTKVGTSVVLMPPPHGQPNLPGATPGTVSNLANPPPNPPNAIDTRLTKKSLVPVGATKAMLAHSPHAPPPPGTVAPGVPRVAAHAPQQFAPANAVPKSVSPRAAPSPVPFHLPSHPHPRTVGGALPPSYRQPPPYATHPPPQARKPTSMHAAAHSKPKASIAYATVQRSKFGFGGNHVVPSVPAPPPKVKGRPHYTSALPSHSPEKRLRSLTYKPKNGIPSLTPVAFAGERATPVPSKPKDVKDAASEVAYERKKQKAKNARVRLNEAIEELGVAIDMAGSQSKQRLNHLFAAPLQTAGNSPPSQLAKLFQETIKETAGAKKWDRPNFVGLSATIIHSLNAQCEGLMRELYNLKSECIKQGISKPTRSLVPEPVLSCPQPERESAPDTGPEKFAENSENHYDEAGHPFKKRKVESDKLGSNIVVVPSSVSRLAPVVIEEERSFAIKNVLESPLLLKHIASFLDPSSLCRCLCVSKQWISRNIFQCQEIWLGLCVKRFSASSVRKWEDDDDEEEDDASIVGVLSPTMDLYCRMVEKNVKPYCSKEGTVFLGGSKLDGMVSGWVSLMERSNGETSRSVMQNKVTDDGMKQCFSPLPVVELRILLQNTGYSKGVIYIPDQQFSVDASTKRKGEKMMEVSCDERFKRRVIHLEKKGNSKQPKLPNKSFGHQMVFLRLYDYAVLSVHIHARGCSTTAKFCNRVKKIQILVSIDGTTRPLVIPLVSTDRNHC